MKKMISLLSIILTICIFTSCTKSIKAAPIYSKTTDTPEKNIIVPGNSVEESGIQDIASHSGSFDMVMSGYKGELFIGVADGKFYGTIKFYNWGNGVPQPLTDLKVTEDKIYFKRVIKTKEDMIRYGGTAYFEQDFYGLFTSDNKMIRGYYRYIGTQDNWEAIKK